MIHYGTVEISIQPAKSTASIVCCGSSLHKNDAIGGKKLVLCQRACINVELSGVLPFEFKDFSDFETCYVAGCFGNGFESHV